MTNENTATDTEYKEVKIDELAFMKDMHQALQDHLYGPGAETGAKVLIDYQELVGAIYKWAGAELAVVLSHCNGAEMFAVAMNADSTSKAGIKAAMDAALEEKAMSAVTSGDIGSLIAAIFGGKATGEPKDIDEGDDEGDPMGDYHGRNE